MENINVDLIVDAKGLSCPMPIVKVKKGIEQISSGEIIELQATDKGSLADMKAWCESTGHEYIGTMNVDYVYKHYIRKSSSDKAITKKHTHVVSNLDLKEKIEKGEDIQIIDVREPAEYIFSHIDEAISIPLATLELNIDTLSKDKETYVVCRTGHRSDLAAQLLHDKGLNHVFNVLPGMSEWN